MDRNQNIEKRILWVAERLFLEKGFSGTSTTEIAKIVGCNQALIHYYFRTKEKLFWDVFTPKIEQVMECLDAPFEENVEFTDRIRNIIDFYFAILELDERLAPFIVNELIMHPTRWNFFRERYLRKGSCSNAFQKFENLIKDEVAKGTIRDVSAIDLLLDIVSLVITSFIVAPMGYARGECDTNERKVYLERRKKDVTELVIMSLKTVR